MSKKRGKAKNPQDRALHALLASIMQFAGSRDPKRRAAIRASLLKPPRVPAPALARALHYPDSFVRWHLINMLGRLADPSTLRRVVKFALEEPELHARWRSYWAVTRFPRERSLPLLLSALRTGSAERKWRAALILSMMGRAEAAPAILRGAAAKDSWKLFEALSAIRSLRIAGAESTLARFLSPKTPVNLRQQAVLAMGALNSRRATALLQRALSDAHPQVRWRAAMCLGHAGFRPPAAFLPRAIKREKDPLVRRHLQESLKKWEGSHA